VGLKYGCAALITKIEEVNGKYIVYAEKKEIAEKKPRGFVHWISVEDAVNCELRLYDLLFTEKEPNKLENYQDGLNPNSCTIRKNAKMHKDLLSSFIPTFFLLFSTENRG